MTAVSSLARGARKAGLQMLFAHLRGERSTISVSPWSTSLRFAIVVARCLVMPVKGSMSHKHIARRKIIRTIGTVVSALVVSSVAYAQTPRTAITTPLSMIGLADGSVTAPQSQSAPFTTRIAVTTGLSMIGLADGTGAVAPQSQTAPFKTRTAVTTGVSMIGLAGDAGAPSSATTPFRPKTIHMTKLAMTGELLASTTPFKAKTVRMSALAMTGQALVPIPTQPFKAKIVRMGELSMTGTRDAVPPIKLPPTKR